MCETTNGTPCPCSETPSANPKRRTCATPGCTRIESGGARHCRTCRTERPLRIEVAKLTEAHERIGADWSRAIACIDATHEILDGANVSRAHHLGGGLSLEGRVESLVRNRDTVVSLYTEVVIKRDEAVRALDLARAAAKGQKERLRRAKAEISTTLDRLQISHAETDATQHHLRAVIEQRDDARGALGVARKESDALRLRLRIMHAVAALLGVAAVAGGVL